MVSLRVSIASKNSKSSLEGPHLTHRFLGEVSDLIDVPTMLKPLLPDTQKIVFMTGAESDSIFPEAVEHIAAKHSGIKIFPTLNSYVGNMSDHHAGERRDSRRPSQE